MTGTDSDDNRKIKIDRDNLYRDETFTDLKIGWIRRLTPVTPEGDNDNNRKSLFIGQTQLITPQGPVPIQCQIPAVTLEEAIESFPEAMKGAIKNVIERAREMQQRENAGDITP